MLTLLVYQALVPILCPECAMTVQEGTQSSTKIKEVVRYVDLLNVQTTHMRWKRVGGCNNCRGRGSIGQTVVAEMLMPDEEWLRPIREGRDVDAVDMYRSLSDRDLSSKDMTGKTVFVHTLFKALNGNVDARQCSRFDNFGRFVKRHNRGAA